VFGVLLVSAFLGGIVFDVTTITLPKLLEERLAGLDLTLSQIGAGAAAIFATAAFAQYAVGTLIDRYPIKPIFLMLEAVKLPVLVAVGLSQGPGAVALAFAMMVLVFGEIPISDTLVARYSAAHWRSRIYAAKSLLSLGVSAVVIPMVSMLHDRSDGFETLFISLGAFVGVTGATALLLPSRTEAAGRAAAGRHARHP
jgi:MFS family permease